MWEELANIPGWDKGLAEQPESTKRFGFGEAGVWEYCVEAPSLWPLDEQELTARNARLALDILGQSRRAQHTERRTALDVLTIANTLSCNLGCTYCYNYGALESKSHPRHSRIDTNTSLDAIDLLFNKSAPGSNITLQFIGGEPLLHWNSITFCIETAFKRATEEHRQIKFGINTNATLLTEEKINWLNKYPVFVFVSYDGPPEIHDRQRLTIAGGPSFALVEKGLAVYLRHYANRFKSCRMTLDFHRTTFSSLVKDALSRGFNDISIGYDAAGLAQEPHHLTRLIDDLPEVERLCRDAYIERRLERFSWYNETWSQLLNAAPKYRSCKAGDGYLATGPEGKLYPCHRYVGSARNVVGDLNEPSLPRAPARFHENTANDDCNHCWARRICGGECFAVLDDVAWDQRKKQTLCVFRRAIFQSALRLFAHMKIRHPSLLSHIAGVANSEIALD